MRPTWVGWGHRGDPHFQALTVESWGEALAEIIGHLEDVYRHEMEAACSDVERETLTEYFQDLLLMVETADRPTFTISHEQTVYWASQDP